MRSRFASAGVGDQRRAASPGSVSVTTSWLASVSITRLTGGRLVHEMRSPGIVRHLAAVARVAPTCGRWRRWGPACSPCPAPTSCASRFILSVQVAEGDAVLRLLVDLLLRMVGAEVALAAVLRLARAARREVVAAVAGGAGAARAVEVEPADAGVGPAVLRRSSGLPLVVCARSRPTASRFVGLPVGVRA